MRQCTGASCLPMAPRPLGLLKMSQQGVPNFPHQENWTETEWKVAGVQFGQKSMSINGPHADLLKLRKRLVQH